MTEDILDSIGPLDILLDDSTVPLRLNGRIYNVRKLTMGDMAALQNRMRKQLDRPPKPQEVALQLATPDGMTFLLWRRLHETDNALTLDTVQDMIPATPDALMTVMKLLGLEFETGVIGNPPTAASQGSQ